MTWKDALGNRIPAALAREIDTYENQTALKRQGKIDDKVFAETRLRRGAYGQRYDNGQRNDGTGVKMLPFPSNGQTKGPDTVWDAPGMQRIKIPFGGLTADQMDTLADLSEEYSDGVCHITTRQDVQLHYVHIDDTPSLMRRLAAVGITTREACGNTVRNVTACPIAGVCRDEPFDVTPYADAAMHFLLGHPDAQNFGRKFKVAFSGCREHACGLVTMHDFGAIAVTREVDGVEQHGFEVHVGGGLGAVPHEARLFEPFMAADEILPTLQAIARVFARLGEKRNRARARVKFLVAQLGLDEFRRLVREERATLAHDEAWTDYLERLPAYGEQPLKTGQPLGDGSGSPAFAAWARTNAYRQRQPGYVVTTVSLPLGDLSGWQLRRLADVARRFVGDTIRTTVEQNIALRWVRESDLPALHRELESIGLARPGAGAIADITACPGTDTCKLGIASSRGLAAELEHRLAEQMETLDYAVRQLRIKISGCFNSCGQHQICDLGFYGVSRHIGGHIVPHFQVVLGGKWADNGGAYGLAIGAVPSKNIPGVVRRITDQFVSNRREAESFYDFTSRVGKRALREMFDDLTAVPPHDVDSDYYRDWGDPREFGIGDMGVGECAGEVVSLTEFDLVGAESQVFEAQLQLETGDVVQADALAYGAMLQAAKGLIKTEFIDISDEPDQIVTEFRTRFFDTEIFFDKYAGGKFAQYLFRRHAQAEPAVDRDTARQLIAEAQLFLEATHACQAKLASQPAMPTAAGRAAVTERPQ
ncbi:MAG: sulfite reductase [Acidobacteria bacterium]|jgi:sulfite reductase (ferredoxin)|nr:sulfite reductase [Acidobacteriota bacterium]MDP7337718.1 nitrite/sulfite reductase [Vicinamibacterales bacterium]MDP7479169.1 nitrite/sulfite reductase [Vicinamibacterales bacterium]HJN45024.1 nitrite/sulfite reductase [Vicinamibacterales bacterium]